MVSIKTSDRIVVLNQGEISSIGTHEELMNSDPIYQNLYQLQFS